MELAANPDPASTAIMRTMDSAASLRMADYLARETIRR